MSTTVLTTSGLCRPTSAWMLQVLQDGFDPDGLHVLAAKIGDESTSDERHYFLHVRSRLATTPKIRLQNGWTCMLRIEEMRRAEACAHSVHGYHLTLSLLHATDTNGRIRGHCEFDHGEVDQA